MEALGRSDSRLTSTYVNTFNRLLQGFTPDQISPSANTERFWSDLLQRSVDRGYLTSKLATLSKDECLSHLKPVLNQLVSACIHRARKAPYDDNTKAHAVETLSILSRCLLAKNLTGWEVMELYAGGAKDSDRVFNDLTAMLVEIIGDNSAPAGLRHAVLQLAVILVCGISQLSPGAYFLRRDFFPCITTIITCPETEQYTFEAVLLLSLLANFHKSDAGKLNPYFKRIRDAKDGALMRKICWASNFAASAVIQSYQRIVDDSPPSLGSALGSFFTSLRPDRALSAKPFLNTSRDLFKNQPIEACVILLPILEFVQASDLFRSAIIEPLGQTSTASKNESRLVYTLYTLFSYILTHASSTSSSRAIAYANLSLNILLAMAEDDKILGALCPPAIATIRLCGQKSPLLPIVPQRAPVCAALDCVVLWARHNLHKRLEVHSYILSVRVARRIVWYLHKENIRLDYHWRELWRALMGLLEFLSNKLDSLITTGEIEQLVKETLWLIDDSLCFSEDILPDARSLHEFVYELVHSTAILRKMRTLLEKVSVPNSPSQKRASTINDNTQDALSKILATTDYYEKKVQESGAQSATHALRVVGRDVDQNGLNHSKKHQGEAPPKQSEDVVGFVRYAYSDGMSLMP